MEIKTTEEIKRIRYGGQGSGGNEKWVRVEDVKRQLSLIRLELDDEYSDVWNNIQDLENELSQSTHRDAITSESDESDKLSRPDVDAVSKCEGNINSKVSPLSNSGRDTLIHYSIITTADHLGVCGIQLSDGYYFTDKDRGAQDWSLVTCKECIKHRGGE